MNKKCIDLEYPIKSALIIRENCVVTMTSGFFITPAYELSSR